MEMKDCFMIVLGLMFTSLFVVRIVQNEKEIRRLRQEVYLDHMTGLYNRSRMLLDGHQKIKEGEPFFLLYMDLNDFKRVNDSYGHLTGDRYLCQIAQAAKQIVGGQGRLYRMSGDEFICIYTGKDICRCILQLQEYPWEMYFADIDFFGFSIGYAQFPDDSAELDKLIHIADSRMYLQKRGRLEKEHHR